MACCKRLAQHFISAFGMHNDKSRITAILHDNTFDPHNNTFIILLSGPPLLFHAARRQGTLRQLGRGEAPDQAAPASAATARQ
jgi:hypothetical protein